jgi:hypothetical protein
MFQTTNQRTNQPSFYHGNWQRHIARHGNHDGDRNSVRIQLYLVTIPRDVYVFFYDVIAMVYHKKSASSPHCSSWIDLRGNLTKAWFLHVFIWLVVFRHPSEK